MNTEEEQSIRAAINRINQIDALLDQLGVAPVDAPPFGQGVLGALHWRLDQVRLRLEVHADQRPR